MSKAIKTIVGVVAAIAIPFAAPAIASSIGLSAAIGSAVGSATAGSVIGGAVTGAALGAAKGAILGEDVGRSALMGGLGGGVGGYTAAPTAPAGGAVGGTGLTPPSPGVTTAGSQYALSGSGGYGLSAGAPAAPGLSMGGPTYAMAPTAAGLSGAMGTTPAGVDYSLTAPTTTFAGAPAGVDYSMAAAPTPTAGMDYSLAAATPTTAATPTMTPTGAPKTFSEALSRAGGEIKAKFMDPKNLADLTLRAAGNLAGSAMAGTGLSDEEQQLLAAQTEELRQLQQSNQALFNQRLEQAQGLIGESRYFDPEYFGLQRARRAQLAGAKAKQAGLRGLTGERRESEARRFDLATGRDVGTAYDVGYMSAVAPRLQTMQAGLQAMPTGYPSSMADYRNLQATYTGAAERARKTQGDIGELFGSLTGGAKAQSRG